MKYLLITSHPYAQSFSAGARDEITKILKEKDIVCDQIDLVTDGFSPVMDSEDLRLWGKGETKDALVRTYQEKLAEADTIVIPFPIWWGTMPAVLKGFFDKVFLPGFAYTYNEQGEMVPVKLDGKKAVVITTMQTPFGFYTENLGDPIGNELLQNTLEKCGISIEKRFSFDFIVSGGRAQAEKYMDQIKDYFRQ